MEYPGPPLVIAYINVKLLKFQMISRRVTMTRTGRIIGRVILKKILKGARAVDLRGLIERDGDLLHRSEEEQEGESDACPDRGEDRWVNSLRLVGEPAVSRTESDSPEDGVDGSLVGLERAGPGHGRRQPAQPRE